MSFEDNGGSRNNRRGGRKKSIISSLMQMNAYRLFRLNIRIFEESKTPIVKSAIPVSTLSDKALILFLSYCIDF